MSTDKDKGKNMKTGTARMHTPLHTHVHTISTATNAIKTYTNIKTKPSR